MHSGGNTYFSTLIHTHTHTQSQFVKMYKICKCAARYLIQPCRILLLFISCLLIFPRVSFDIRMITEYHNIIYNARPPQ